MHRGHVARRRDCRAILCRSRAEFCGRRQSKQELLRRCRQMHAKHADGPESGMVVHGSDRSDRARGAAPVRRPLSHPRVLRTSACICVKPLLASPRAARCCDGPRIAARQPKPHAPIRLPAAAPTKPAGGRHHRRPAKTPCTNSRRQPPSPRPCQRRPPHRGVRRSRIGMVGKTPCTNSAGIPRPRRRRAHAAGHGVAAPHAQRRCPTGAAHRLTRSGMRRW